MSSAGCLRKDADELLRLATLTKSENVKRILTFEATKLVQVAESEEKSPKHEAQQQASPSAAKSTAVVSKMYNYGWDQSDKFLKIYVTFNGVHAFPSSNIKAVFEQKSFELEILNEDKKVNNVLSIKNLLHPIVPAESYSKIKTDMVVLFLKKSSLQNWAYVTETEKKAKDVKTPKMDKEEDPGASLMTLMKQMYDDGDDEMKRTLAKAWTEARDKRSPDEMM